MNWPRGLFRLWIVGSALFVVAIAFLYYSSIKKEFDDVAIAEARIPAILAAKAALADLVYAKFYGDMPRDEFKRKIAAAEPVTEPETVARLEATVTHLDTSRPLKEWTDDELLVYGALMDLKHPWAPWKSVGRIAGIAMAVGSHVRALTRLHRK